LLKTTAHGGFCIPRKSIQIYSKRRKNTSYTFQ